MSIDQTPEARGSNYYHAQGCYIAPSCLTCPLSVCIEEVPGGPDGFAYRNLQIRTAKAAGLSIEAVATAFGVTVKTARRACSRKAADILSWRVTDDREDL
jgi:hypothetical protein